MSGPVPISLIIVHTQYINKLWYYSYPIGLLSSYIIRSLIESRGSHLFVVFFLLRLENVRGRWPQRRPTRTWAQSWLPFPGLGNLRTLASWIAWKLGLANVLILNVNHITQQIYIYIFIFIFIFILFINYKYHSSSISSPTEVWNLWNLHVRYVGRMLDLRFKLYFFALMQQKTKRMGNVLIFRRTSKFLGMSFCNHRETIVACPQQ
jgi:hypothetical protein